MNLHLKCRINFCTEYNFDFGNTKILLNRVRITWLSLCLLTDSYNIV